MALTEMGLSNFQAWSLYQER